MTTKPTQIASHTIASTLADLLSLAEEIARAHDRLALPEHDDVAVDWPAVLTQVDALGDASHRIATLAKERMIPCLKSLKTHAQTALDEIARLDAQLAPTPTEAPRA